ncbi:unnamed protein product [Bursaphelenchus okinawaensis]|uniref:Zinc carboxypeptidase A 1 n=1 Tax=Bursaphelenchus okinawaensis TaxID=465554 RepID=A0A811JTJ7_9BILA|nr:unnamed protein product [Bursaphelenchus okinawaensis]CAG9082771.1 unnamed protein product [Bursaphelenchus okinawaensis]
MKMVLVWLFLPLVSCLDLSDWPVTTYDDDISNFTDYRVFRITPSKADVLSFLRTLYWGLPHTTLDFWQPPTSLNHTVDVAVAPAVSQRFFNELYYRQIPYQILIPNLQQAIDEERTIQNVQMDAHHIHFDRYNTFEQIESYLFDIHQKYPHLVKLREIGKSYENRTLWVVQLGKPRTEKKAKLWIDAGIHAREWISPAVALAFINKLLTGYGKDEEITELMDYMDWLVLPVMNPDGYVHTFAKNRMWRKNRRPSSCYKTTMSTMCCVGVDLNRNFNWFWATTGSSTDPCHDTYHGTGPFSESESRSVKEFLEKTKVDGFMSFHSYSQLWLIPYGHKKRTYPEDYSTVLKPLALQATNALGKLYGTKYIAGTGADLMYEASGASHDFAKGNLQIKYAYLVELRPQNTMFANGFLLPEREIVPTCEETWEAVKVVAHAIINDSQEGITTQIRQTITPAPYTEQTQVTFTTNGLIISTKEVTTEPTVMPNRIVQCVDHSRYCKWWKVHHLCHKERVKKQCPLSCLAECKI